jgi:hypothetical protein
LVDQGCDSPELADRQASAKDRRADQRRSLIKMMGNGGPYVLRLWSQRQFFAANGNVASLPQSYGAIASQNAGTATAGQDHTQRRSERA